MDPFSLDHIIFRSSVGNPPALARVGSPSSRQACAASPPRRPLNSFHSEPRTCLPADTGVSPAHLSPPLGQRLQARSSSPFPCTVKDRRQASSHSERPPDRPTLGTAPRAESGRSVGLVRVELTTSRLSGVRSNHLSYRPIAEWFPRPAFPALPGKWPLQDPARARRVRCIQ